MQLQNPLLSVSVVAKMNNGGYQGPPCFHCQSDWLSVAECISQFHSDLGFDLAVK